MRTELSIEINIDEEEEEFLIEKYQNCWAVIEDADNRSRHEVAFTQGKCVAYSEMLALFFGEEEAARIRQVATDESSEEEGEAKDEEPELDSADE